MDYSQYLQGDVWKKRRSNFIKKYGKDCKLCGKNGFAVHYLSYENIGQEPDEDLVHLCKSCHFHVHRTKDGTKVNNAYLRHNYEQYEQAVKYHKNIGEYENIYGQLRAYLDDKTVYIYRSSSKLYIYQSELDELISTLQELRDTIKYN